MSDEPWDKPSERLRRMASVKVPEHMRLCPSCDHPHREGWPCSVWMYRKKGEQCGCTK